MNKHLQQLIDLSIIDKEIDAFEPQIEEANYNYEAALAKTKSIESDIENLTAEIKEEEIKKAKNELHLTELSQKLEENAKKRLLDNIQKPFFIINYSFYKLYDNPTL